MKTNSIKNRRCVVATALWAVSSTGRSKPNKNGPQGRGYNKS
jgi:hypothetical protein